MKSITRYSKIISILAALSLLTLVVGCGSGEAEANPKALERPAAKKKGGKRNVGAFFDP